MKVLKFALGWFILNVFVIQVSAQNPDILNEKLADFTIDLPPLQALIDSAYAHNPLLKYRELDFSLQNDNLKTERTAWLKNIGVQTDVRYGTFDHYTTTSSSEGFQPVNVAGSSNEFRFSVGAYMRLPLSEAINRKNQLKIGKKELEKAASMAENQRDFIRQEVIKQYNDVQLKIELFRIKVKQRETAKINMQMAEKEFINGVIPVTEFARLSDINVGVESNFAISRSELTTSLMLLEDLTGVKFKVNQSLKGSNENN